MKKKQYFISFVEYCIFNEKYQDYVGGRIEITDNDDKDNPYPMFEISYLTNKKDEYFKFRKKYDFKNVDKKTLDKIIMKVKKDFCGNN